MYAFAIPIFRKDTSNMTKAVTLLLKHFKDRFGVYSKLAQFDDGKEFYNVGVEAFWRNMTSNTSLQTLIRRRQWSNDSTEPSRRLCGSTSTQRAPIIG